VRLRSLRVTDAMTRDAFVVNHNAPFDDLVRVFMDQRVGAVPVVDDGERLVGIISYVDVFKNAGAL
jgi:predicted transcriptional regulator